MPSFSFFFLNNEGYICAVSFICIGTVSIKIQEKAGEVAGGGGGGRVKRGRIGRKNGTM